MTAKTSQHLADTLRSAGFEELAKRAEADQFHDFLSDSAYPDLDLDTELVQIIRSTPVTSSMHIAAVNIRGRHHQGEFDASKEESDEWAMSPDGQAAFAELTRGLTKDK